MDNGTLRAQADTATKQASSKPRPTYEEPEGDPRHLPLNIYAEDNLTMLNIESSEEGSWLKEQVGKLLRKYSSESKGKANRPLNWISSRSDWCYGTFVVGKSREPNWPNGSTRRKACNSCRAANRPCVISEFDSGGGTELVVLPVDGNEQGKKEVAPWAACSLM